jgi:hypothetical protein
MTPAFSIVLDGYVKPVEPKETNHRFSFVGNSIRNRVEQKLVDSNLLGNLILHDRVYDCLP